MRTVKKLSADDERAVDLLLDHGAGEARVKRLSPPVPQKRLAAVKSVLGRLEYLVVGDPPSGLAMRTVAAIENDARLRIVSGSVAGGFGTQVH